MLNLSVLGKSREKICCPLPAVEECDVLALFEELGPAPPVNTPDAKEPPPTFIPPKVLDPSDPGLVRSSLSDITEKGRRHMRPSLSKNAK